MEYSVTSTTRIGLNMTQPQIPLSICRERMQFKEIYRPLRSRREFSFALRNRQSRVR